MRIFRLTRASVLGCTLFLGCGLFAPSYSLNLAAAQDQDDKTGERLDAIEKKLGELADNVQTILKGVDLKGAAAADEEPTASPDSETENRPDLPTAMPLGETWLGDVDWRSLGPANMGGRVTDIEVHSQDSSTWWIATGGGGLLKTSNRGVTVEHQFDQQTTVSIGAIASDPNDKNVLWVGTGEINPRNSVSYGDGIYKSTDGGKTFANMGLKETYQIGRILVHPQDGKTVYVAAQGRLYGANEDRGVYKTTDGGETWEKIFYLDDQTGALEMIMHPEDPNTIIVAMWDRLRDGFDSWPGSVKKPDGIDGYDPIRKWGPKAGLYKTTDGGKNWGKLTKGLPTGMTGRIGLDWQSKSPHVIYAIIDGEDIGKGPKPYNAFLGLVGVNDDGKAIVTQVMTKSPAAEVGIEVGDVLTGIEGEDVANFDDLLAVLREKKIGERIRFTVQRDQQSIEVNPKLTTRPGVRGRGPAVFMGVTGEDKEQQILLTKITKGGPAEKAGLLEGDTLLTVNGEKPADYAGWIEAVQELAIGDELKLSIKRGDDTIDLALVLGERAGSQPPSSAIMGIQGEPAEDGGAVLTSITEGGPSEKAGLKQDDVVVKIDGQDISDYEALIEAIRSRQPEDSMKVEVRRGDEIVEANVVLGDRDDSSEETRPYTYSYFGQTPNIQDQQGAEGYRYGGVYKSTDAGESWIRVNSLNVRPMYFSVVKVDPSDENKVYVLGVSQFRSDDGGATFTSDFGRGVHSDCHDLWIDPNDGRQMVIGSDGGFYVTYDRGSNWDHINTAAVGQFYHVAIGLKKPYWVYGGLQDNGSWGGPAISQAGGVLNEDWISVGSGDGFVCRVDAEDPDLIYSESQNGSIRRRNLRTGDSASIRPPRVQGKSYRFNWNTPFILSHHNSKIFYSAGNYVFRSLDRGNDLKLISPEITLSKRGSATALAESPRDSNVLYVGTDDGALWVTRDGGIEWINIRENLGIDPRWVATIEPSKYKTGRVYVCLDGHRSDDDRPLAFISEDFGSTFTPLTESLPRGSSRCLREDVVNENLLYMGTEFALWVSLDRGQNWTQFNQSLPTVAVHEVAMHESLNEIVVATHGRSLWACDVQGLRQLNAEMLTEKVALHSPTEVIRWRREPSRGRTNRRYVGENPDSGATLWYSVPSESKFDKISLRIENIVGTAISTLRAKTDSGLHGLNWNLTQTQNLGPGNQQRRPRPVPNGDYRVVLVVDGKDQSSRVVTVKADPNLPADAISAELFESLQLEQDEETEDEEREEAGEETSEETRESP